MVNFTIDQLREAMNNQQNIRNISVIAHVDHGKSTLTDSLLAKAGIISEDNSGKQRATDNRKDEQERGITIKSTGVSMLFDFNKNEENKEKEKDENVNLISNVEKEINNNKYLINLIDSPGHVDFSSEVTAALRVTDGALVVVDYVEGVCVQTETVLRQSLMELIKPVLVINKVDRAFFELKNDAESIYQNFQRVIESFNIVVSTYQKETMEDLQVDPQKGEVVFGSAYQGWGFSLTTIANIYNKKFGIKTEKILNKLWGNNFFNKTTNKFTTEREEEYPRAFCVYAIEPIIKLIDVIKKGNKTEILNYTENLGVKIQLEETIDEKSFFKQVMKKWINLADSLIELVVMHLPSPLTAQQYRTNYLYTGMQDDNLAKAMLSCNPDGPLMMFVSKMVPSPDGSRFYAFGRVFSGKVECSKKVKIMGPNYKPGKTDDVFEKTISSVVIMMGKKIETVTDVPCGNTCALVGIDQCLVKQGTVSDDKEANIIRSMKYSVSPVVRVAIAPKNPSDLTKLIEGMKRMAKSDPLVQVLTSEKENIIAGSGELHLEICLNDLYNEYTNQIEIIKSDPIVPYQESITEKSSQTCLAKSANKLNRLFINAEPLEEEIVEKIESGEFNVQSNDLKYIASTLQNEFGWDSHDAKKVWAFGLETCTNVVVDKTEGVQYLSTIKDSLISTFNWVSREGVLAEESLRGVRFNILDTSIHSDPSHRGSNQIVPASRRAFLSSELCAEPRLVEPIFLVDISCPTDSLGGVYQCINQRRGIVFSEEGISGTPMVMMKCFLPVSESFGFNGHLRNVTSGKAFPQMAFNHWEVINSNPFEENSTAMKIIKEIRKRKGIKTELPKLEDLVDKL